MAVAAALDEAGATALPLDVAPLDAATGAAVLAWVRAEPTLPRVVWVGDVPPWAEVRAGDVRVTWDGAAGALVVALGGGSAPAAAALPAIAPAGDAARGHAGAGPGRVGTLVLDATGQGWPEGVAAGAHDRLVSTRWQPDVAAVAVAPSAAAVVAAWVAAATEVVLRGDPADAQVAGWAADARAAGRPVHLVDARGALVPVASPTDLPALATVLREALRLAPEHVVVHGERVPRVSVVVPTFNSAPFVRATIESILEQTFDDLELVVVDDGSSDGTDRIVEGYLGDERVRLLRQANLGHLVRWELSNNRLWALTRGELVARLDGDDVAAPDRLARQVAAIDADRRVGLVHTAGVRIDEHGRPQGPLFGLPAPYDTRTQLRTLLAANVVAHPTVLVRRALLARVEAYAGGWASDYDLWLRLARATRFRFLPEPLVAYRVHGGGTSSTGAGAERSVAEGVATRSRLRARLTIGELVPELPPGAGVPGTLAAHVELARHLLALGGPPNAPLALAELDQALGLAPHPLVGVAAVTAALVGGDDDELRRRVAWVEAAAPGALAAARAQLGPVPEVGGAAVWPDLGTEPPEWGAGHVDALGAAVGRMTLRWRPPVDDPAALRTVVGAYLARFGPADPVRLVLHLDAPAEEALAVLGAALGDLEGLGEGAALELADPGDDAAAPGALDVGGGPDPLSVLDRARRWLTFADNHAAG
jgi:GT2 family glycosyltransferase